MTTSDILSEKEAQHWYDLGRSVGLNAASGILAESARGYFAREQDQLAKAFRAEAKRLKLMADEARPGGTS